jgi:hypothetical protein
MTPIQHVKLVKILSVCVSDLLFQLEQANGKSVNSDFAVALMERVGAELQGLDGEGRAEFVSVLRQLEASEADSTRKQFLNDFADNFGLSS